MSSAILYLAIIAIWACFLVPAWVRRPHAKSGHPAEAADWFGAVPGEEHSDEQPYEHSYAQAGIAVAEAQVRDAGLDGGGRHGGVLYEDAAYPADTENDVDSGRKADIHVGAGRHQEYRDGAPAYAADSVPEHRARPGSGAEFTAAGAAAFLDAMQPHYGPSQSREQMLRARRKMLTILVTMTAVTGAFAFLGVVGWWICVPPAGMLVLYVLLLREVAMADAELARKRHAQAMREARAEAAAARQRAYSERANLAAERSGQGSGANPGAAEPTAQIIDISGRVGDQLYDQYADAAARAVGD